LTKGANGAVTDYQYNAGDELTTITPASGAVITQSFDRNGNLISRYSDGAYLATYSWDHENRLTAKSVAGAEPLAYAYSAEGHRQALTIAGVWTCTFTWDGENVLEAYAFNGDIVVRNTDNPGYWGGLTSANLTIPEQFTEDTFVYGYDLQGSVVAFVTSVEGGALFGAGCVYTPYTAYGELLGATPLSLAAGESIQVGDTVAAIGHPEGGGLWTLTTGTVSALRKMGRRDIVQSQASLNPGNSGGPLLNANGQVVGVNSFVSRSGSSSVTLEGLNFAIRSNVARTWLNSKGVAVAYGGGSTPAPEPAAPPPAPAVVPPAPPPVAPAPPAAPPVAPPPTRPAAPAVPPVVAPPPVAPPTPAKPPAGELDEKEFRGPDGQLMYGLPKAKVPRGKLLQYLTEQTRKHAQSAFDELDKETTKGTGDEE